MTDSPSNAPNARLCHISKWPDFDGYGFNLHAEKSRPGQYIGKVDEKSPADVAGLKEGDRIIEVNGVNISNENHKQVVQRIKAVSNETRLLVVSADADQWHKDHNLVVRGDQSNIIYGNSEQSSSTPPPENHDNHNSPDETQSNKSTKSNKSNTTEPHAHEEDGKSLGSSSCHSEISNQAQSPMSTTPSPPPSLNPDGSLTSQQNSITGNSTAPSTHSGLNLNMTAAEMRAHLATRKKFDPRKDQIDLKRKYEIVQNM